MYDRDALIAIVREKALRFGDFTLASGKKASYYLDCRCVALDSNGIKLVADGMISAWGDNWPDAVGGMAVGAVPITAGILSCVGNDPRRERFVDSSSVKKPKSMALANKSKVR